MKTDFFLDDYLGPEFKSKFGEVAEQESDQFDELIGLIGLNPSYDFIDADLAGSDFSNSNLNGYNFSGADLSFCIGLNVQWNDQTKFEGARIDGSIFASSVVLDRELKTQPVALRTISHMKKQDIYSRATWVMNGLKSRNPDLVGNQLAVRKLMEKEENITVKNNFIYTAKNAFKTEDEYREFLVNIFSRRESDETSFRACLKILATSFSYDPIVEELLLLSLKKGAFNHKLMALEGLLTSRNANALHSKVYDILSAPALLEFRKRLINRAYEEFANIDRDMEARTGYLLGKDLIIYGERYPCPLSWKDFTSSINEDDLEQLLVRLAVREFFKHKRRLSREKFADKTAEYLLLYHSEGEKFFRAIDKSGGKFKSELPDIPEWMQMFLNAAIQLKSDLGDLRAATGVKYRFKGKLASVFLINEIHVSVAHSLTGNTPREMIQKVFG